MASSVNNLSGIRILVAEDDSGLLDVLTVLLTGMGMTVFAVSDGREALKLLAEHEVDFILSDIQMPNVDGLELLRAVRLRDPKKPPLVFLTGQSHVSAAEAVERGARGLMEKPVHFKELFECIGQICRNQDPG